MRPLCFPEKILDQHVVWLGKTGAGKSSAMRHVVEWLLTKKKRVCIIDPKGDWWGLKSSADGQAAGFEVVAFGGFKEEKATDIPINGHSGKAIAELVATGNRPCVIGFRGWMPSDMTRFWVDFASTLFNSNGGELFVVVDEVHNFAPKGRVMDVEAGKCLHWTNRLLTEGRGLGLVFLVASQRPQKVHNDTLTSCETLCAMRVNHAADRTAIEDWIDGCGDPKLSKELLANVASLPRGEAYVWSPEIGFGPKRVPFPMFETFDSFAPPQLQRKVSEKGWGATDLDAVRAKLKSVIEVAQANDPAALRKRISALERELKDKRPAPGAPQEMKTVTVEVPVLSEQHAKNIDYIGRQIEDIRSALLDSMNEIKVIAPQFETLRATVEQRLKQFASASQHVARPAAAETSPHRKVPTTVPGTGNSGNGSLGKCERAILAVLAQHEQGCEAGKLTLLTRYRYSGGFKNSLASLRVAGHIEGENTRVMKITSAGLDALGQVALLPEGSELAEYWMQHISFGKCERAILQALLDNAKGLTADVLCEITNYEYSGGFKNALASLRTAGVLVGRNTETMRASEELFD